MGPNPTRNWTTTQAYDQLNRLTQWLVQQTGGGSTVHNYQYQFDGASDRTQVVADPKNSSGQIVPNALQGVPHSNESDLAYTPVNEILTTTAYTAQGQVVGTATWTYDATGNQTGNSGYPGVSPPLTVTYNQHNQIATITDLDQHAVAMGWTGPGLTERTSANWSNDPANQMYGQTTYISSTLGLASIANNTGTTYLTRDPSGLPVGLRTPGGTYYYVFDGQGNVVMMVDPPSGAPVVIYSMCPTGNASGDNWKQTGFTDENVLLALGALGLMNDFGTKQLYGAAGFLGSNSGNPNSTAVLIINGYLMPTIAWHIFLAQAVGYPNRLNYDPSSVAQTQRRQAACGKAPSIPGLSCDEYPFAKTTQGGAGSSTWMVPAREQSIQGGVLRWFYSGLRPNEAFYVVPLLPPPWWDLSPQPQPAQPDPAPAPAPRMAPQPV